jgi:hypothetical protein
MLLVVVVVVVVVVASVHMLLGNYLVSIRICLRHNLHHSRGGGSATHTDGDDDGRKRVGWPPKRSAFSGWRAT